MAAVSAFNHFPCKTLSANAATQRSLVSKRSLAIVPSSDLAGEVAGSRRYAIAVQNRGVRPVLRIRAAAGEEFETAVAVEEEEKPKQSDEVEELKKSLVASFYGTDRGLRSSSETRAEIVELIHQLEALNPTPAPTDALTRLNGKWILAYTLFPGLFPLFSTPPTFVKVDEISQTIDSENFTVQNSVKFTGPLATTSLTTNAKFEIRSPKRVQLKFEEGIIGTPQLTNSIEIPENVNVLGQKIELAPFKGLITPFQSTASSVAKTISNQSPLKIPVTNANAESWLLTTYLDDELRISKGDGGTVFVLIKEGSSLLS